ncbi:hypothetical protein HYC85_011021 [Camellia sinensis]|uniref:Uncharacterized protein n=1 Tax=Camellia sinensis TaxID=4442 RepID=A0A7J7HKZ3_CAMSI|nr:hypothetical protein HYC85_011021 [Camellia sinensis]
MGLSPSPQYRPDSIVWSVRPMKSFVLMIRFICFVGLGILLERKESIVGVLVCGPKNMRLQPFVHLGWHTTCILSPLVLAGDSHIQYKDEWGLESESSKMI